MNTKVIDLKNQKRNLLNEIEKVSAVAIKEVRGYNADEQSKLDQMLAADKIIDDAIKTAEIQESLSQSANSFAETHETRSSDPRKSKTYTEFRKTLNRADNFGTLFMEPEHRALSNASAAAGGALIPEVWSSDVIKAIDTITLAGRLARKIGITKADTMHLPIWGGISAATRVGEAASATADSSTNFTDKTFTPTAMSVRLSVSRKLIRSAIIDMDSFLAEEFARQFAYKTEAEFMTGNGSSALLGIFTADANGIPTSQNQAAASQTTVVYDDLINVKYKLGSQYHSNPKTAWVMHPDAVKIVLKLKDSANMPIFQTNVQAGLPPTLLGDALFISSYAPSTFTAGLSFAIYGCFDYYTIVESLGVSMEMQADPANDSTVFYGRLESAGSPTLGTAFTRLVMAP